MKRLVRSLSVFFRLIPYLVGFLRDRKRWIVVGRPAHRSRGHHERRAQRLVSTLAGLGPTFVKLAQLLSARADILPEPYLSEISTLQDQVPPDPAEEIIRVVEEELDEPVDDLFDGFQRDPIAAASLGQVHRARVDDRDVVVKVLRPGVEAMVALDLDISFRVLFWLNILFPDHRVQALTNVVREFSVRVREEMDFRQEAENMARFREAFRHERGVRAPEALERFTTRRVLVMEYHAGTKVNKLHDRVESGDVEVRRVMERLTTLYLRMMMVDGFIHADPHPGNLLVAPDGAIVVLDWGMVLTVPKWTREDILNTALAVGNEDLDGMINGMYRLGMISPQVSRGEIREAATEIMRILERFQTSNRARIQELVGDIFNTFYTWPLMLPQEMVYFFRTAALLEGIGFLYDPDFYGLELVRSVIRKERQQILKSLGKEPMALARDFFGETREILRSVRDLLERAEREELRVRVHPRDMQGQERFMHLQARRLLLSIFASATAVISAVLFISVREWWLLAGGLGAALFMFVLVFFIPTHLLENPLRHARGIRPGHRAPELPDAPGPGAADRGPGGDGRRGRQ